MKSSDLSGLLTYVLAVGFPCLAVGEAPGKVVLENKWLRVEVSPREGGRVVSLVHKALGRNFTRVYAQDAAPAGSGLLADRLWGRRQIRDLEVSPYQVVRAASRAMVLLRRVHKFSAQSAVIVEKMLRLPENRASLLVNYAISNLSAGNWEGRIWLASLLAPSARAAQALTFHFPTGFYREDYGVRPGRPGRWSFPYQPQSKASRNIWMGNLRAGWMAVTSADHAGAVIHLDPSYLDDVYCYQPRGNHEGRPMATLEALFGPVLLRPVADDKARGEIGIQPLVGQRNPGRPWKTRLEFLPSVNLGDEVIGADDGLAVGATQHEKMMAIHFTAACRARLRADISLKSVTGGNSGNVGGVDLTLEPGQTVTKRFPVPRAVRVSRVLVARIQREHGRPILMFLPKFKNDAEARTFREEPPVQRKTDFKTEVQFPDLREGAATPHVAWMRPLRVKPKLLLVLSEPAARDYFELKQRLDANIDVALIAFPHYLVYRSAPKSDPRRILPLLLKKPHDLIVLPGGLCWGILPPKIREEIVRQVKQGTGLLFMSPKLGDHLVPARGGIQKETLTECARVPGAGNKIIQGVPRLYVPLFREWPSLGRGLRTGRLGKGRVAIWDVPIWPFRRPYLVRQSILPFVQKKQRRGVEFPFEEYHYLLALKIMAWCARQEMPVTVQGTVRADGPALSASIALKQTGREKKVALETTWLNRRGEVMARSIRSLPLAGGMNQIELKPKNPRSLVPGPVFLNVRVLDEAGRVLGTGAAEGLVRRGISFQELDLDKFGHDPGEPVRGAAVWKGTARPGARIQLRVWDMHGRLLARSELPAGLKSGRQEFQDKEETLLGNGGFETGPAGPTSKGKVPPRWYHGLGKGAPPIEVVRSARPGSRGNQCLKIKTGTRRQAAGLYSPLLPIDPARPLKVSGWVKSSGPSGKAPGAYFGIGWYDADQRGIILKPGTTLNYAYVFSAYRGDQWKQFSRLFRPVPQGQAMRDISQEIPPRAAFINIRVFNLEYPLPSWFDDLAVTQDIAAEKEGESSRKRFSLSLIESYSVLQRLEARLLSPEGTVLDAASAEFTVRPPQPKDVTFQIWGPRYQPTSVSGRLEARLIRQVGFDYALAHVGLVPPDEVRAEALGLLREHLRPMPMTLMRIGVRPGTLSGVVREPCLSSPEFRTDLRAKAQAYVSRLRDLYPPAYFNGDENSLGHYSSSHDFCQSPSCLERFRAFLLSKYGSLEKLGREWSRPFENWDSVKPFTLEEARKAANWTPWIEHRIFMTTVLADTVRYQRQIVREEDPAGRLAISGMGRPTLYTDFLTSRNYFDTNS